MCPTLFYLNFFEIRLTRGDVWAKTEVLVIGTFLCCILGSYLLIRATYQAAEISQATPQID